jgi:hypothetical protein
MHGEDLLASLAIQPSSSVEKREAPAEAPEDVSIQDSQDLDQVKQYILKLCQIKN